MASMGALSFSPSPMTTRPVNSTPERWLRMASTAAASAESLSPLPSQRAAATAADSVTRTISSARLRLVRDNDAAEAASSSAPRSRSAAAGWRARIFLSALTRFTLARNSSALSSGRVSGSGTFRARGAGCVARARRLTCRKTCLGEDEGGARDDAGDAGTEAAEPRRASATDVRRGATAPRELVARVCMRLDTARARVGVPRRGSDTPSCNTSSIALLSTTVRLYSTTILRP